MRTLRCCVGVMSVLVLAGQASGEALCVDFGTFPAGSTAPNPRVERGIPFAVYDFQGTLATQSRIGETAGIRGLEVDRRTRVQLPEAAPAVEVVLVCYAEPALVEAFDAQGASVGQAVVTGLLSPQTLRLVGTAPIQSVDVAAPEGEALLLAFCADARVVVPGEPCIDFSAMGAGTTLTNPTVQQGTSFQVFDESGAVGQIQISAMGGSVGMDVGRTTLVYLSVPARTVELTLVHFATAASVQAVDVAGVAAGAATMSEDEGEPQTLRIASATPIERLYIEAPQAETLLIRLCASGTQPTEAGPSSWGQVKGQCLPCSD